MTSGSRASRRKSSGTLKCTNCLALALLNKALFVQSSSYVVIPSADSTTTYIVSLVYTSKMGLKNAVGRKRLRNYMRLTSGKTDRQDVAISAVKVGCCISSLAGESAQHTINAFTAPQTTFIMTDDL